MNVDDEIAVARMRIHADIDARIERIAREAAAAFHALLAEIDRQFQFHRRSIAQQRRRALERGAVTTVTKAKGHNTGALPRRSRDITHKEST